MSEIKRIDIREFRELGYLQEANRQFFHPLGLALEVQVPETSRGKETLGGVWDYRDDPEGVYYAEGYGLDPEKAARVLTQVQRMYPRRIEALGFWIQPLVGQDHHDPRADAQLIAAEFLAMSEYAEITPEAREAAVRLVAGT